MNWLHRAKCAQMSAFIWVLHTFQFLKYKLGEVRVFQYFTIWNDLGVSITSFLFQFMLSFEPADVSATVCLPPHLHPCSLARLVRSSRTLISWSMRAFSLRSSLSAVSLCRRSSLCSHCARSSWCQRVCSCRWFSSCTRRPRVSDTSRWKHSDRCLRTGSRQLDSVWQWPAVGGVLGIGSGGAGSGEDGDWGRGGGEGAGWGATMCGEGVLMLLSSLPIDRI